MRKGLLLVGMAAALGANAVRLTPEAALQRVIDAPQAKAMAKPVTAGRTPMLVYTEEINAQPAAYLFDRGEGNGYLIVSADDEVAPLLGYSDAGAIDVTDMPDGLRYWLGYYAAEIENVRTNGTVSVLAASPARKAIAPMVATRWNQSAPYNNMCPTSGSDRCVTGCVATALAQVMKYHNWRPKVREATPIPGETAPFHSTSRRSHTTGIICSMSMTHRPQLPRTTLSPALCTAAASPST